MRACVDDFLLLACRNQKLLSVFQPPPKDVCYATGESVGVGQNERRLVLKIPRCITLLRYGRGGPGSGPTDKTNKYKINELLRNIPTYWIGTHMCGGSWYSPLQRYAFTSSPE